QATLKDPGNLFGGFDVTQLEGTDKFGIKATLEKRTGDMVIIIAQAELESDQETDTMTEMKMELQYLSDDDPTHFHISFSPSVDGGEYKGAIGSSLIIDDLKMIYE
ncbi:MAG: PCMD domain-containing protein, partial [Bacteroidales bacterium]|nr:PCMD domain-containing protein [Bacteroidales bacterium]